jgi:hypothetical protein
LSSFDVVGGSAFRFALKPYLQVNVVVAVFGVYTIDPVGAVAVTVTGPLVAFTQVAVPLVSSAALLMITSFGSELVHVTSTDAISAGTAHPVPETTNGALRALNFTWFAGAVEAWFAVFVDEDEPI